ncbi:MAG: hypothetical protein U0790_19310 [Isosphaeraceae bacterium]
MNPGHSAAGRGIDLSNCDREPIHIPGRIQSHGVLFALAEPDLTVLQVSRNVDDHIGLRAEEVIGGPIDLLFGPEGESWRRRLLDPGVHEAGHFRVMVGGRPFDATAHRYTGALILELENGREDDAGTRSDDRAARMAMARLQTAPTLLEFCRVAAAEMRALTGFDRVTVYRFDEGWNGQVFAESRRDDLAPLLGLHFPASDIPEQARGSTT